MELLLNHNMHISERFFQITRGISKMIFPEHCVISKCAKCLLPLKQLGSTKYKKQNAFDLLLQEFFFSVSIGVPLWRLLWDDFLKHSFLISKFSQNLLSQYYLFCKNFSKAKVAQCYIRKKSRDCLLIQIETSR